MADLDDFPPFAQLQRTANYWFDRMTASYQGQMTSIPGGEQYRWYRGAFAHAFTSAYLSYNYGSATAALLGQQRERLTWSKYANLGWGRRDVYKDTFNNEEGAEIGAHFRQNGMAVGDTFLGIPLNYEYLAEEVMRATVDGRLIVFHNRITDSGGIDDAHSGDSRLPDSPPTDINQLLNDATRRAWRNRARPSSTSATGAGWFGETADFLPAALTFGFDDELSVLGLRRNADGSFDMRWTGGYTANDWTDDDSPFPSVTSADGLHYVTAYFDAEGRLVTVELTEQEYTALLNLQENARIQAELEALMASSAPKLDVDMDALMAMDTGVTGADRISPLEESFLTGRIDENGDLVLSGFKTRTIDFDPRTGIGQYAIETGVDEHGRIVAEDWIVSAVAGPLEDTGIRRVRDGQVEIYSEPGQPTTIRLVNSQIGIDFVNAAETIASVFGRHFIGGNTLVQTVSSAALQTLGSNFGDILNTAVFDSGVSTTANMERALEGIGPEFLANLKASGVSALSAYLTGELVAFIGLEGFEAEALNTIAGSVVTQIVGNLAEMALGTPGVTVFSGVANLAQLGNVAGGFLGNHLATKIGNWDEVGEQLGSSIGGALGGIVGQTLIPVPVLGAIIGSFLGNLVGGLIGGVFTGTPKSGAIVEFDETSGLFGVEAVWKEDGGQKRVARELGTMAAEALNGIVGFVGGELVNGSEIDAGSYGLRGKRFVYWEDDTASDNRVKFKEAEDLIEYGVLEAIREFEFLGGDVYAKRAFHATLAIAGVQGSTAETGGVENFAGQLYDSQALTTVDFTLDTLLGNFAVVDRLHEYLESASTINALIAAEPNSGFAADWMLAFARMDDLGLWRRSSHDWAGGFGYLLHEAQIDASDVQFSFELFGDGLNGERVAFLGPWFFGDTVDSGSKTVVVGGDEDDLLTGHSGGPGHIANVLRGGTGDDELVAAASGDDLFGGAGNDLLVGGALDDWLFGGSGSDVLDAGGGNGNMLSGDSGNDFLTGADRPVNSEDGGSDWLAAGDGDDVLRGRGGDDFLEGGEGQDNIDGGAGSDTVVYRSGHGIDRVADTGSGSDEHDAIEFSREIVAADATVVARSAGETLSIFLSEETGGGRIDLRGVAFGETAGIDQFRFGDESWSRGDLTGAAIFSKTAGATLAETSADEDLLGTIHDDSLTGGGGSDTLAGGLGSDVYTFNLGDGVDTIVEAGFAADLDTLVFGAGIAATDLAVAYSSSQPHDLLVTVGTGGDQVILKDQLAPDGANSIEQVLFADGTSWTIRDLIALAPSAAATSGADTLSGTYRADVIAAGNGNDVLTGRFGDDSLDGGSGSDTFHYGLGDGNDRIHDSRHIDGGSTNTLVLGAGIAVADLLLARDHADANNIRISFANAAGSILIDNQFYTTNYGFTLYDHGFDSIQFADGTQWTRATLIAQSILQASTARSDYVQGSRFGDTITVAAGNDVAAAGDGNDVLTGGLGNDNLDGGYGSDTYHYALGDGDDRIWDSRYRDGGPTNVLHFGTGIAAGDLILERDLGHSLNLRITFAGQAGSILIDNQLDWNQYGSTLYDDGIDTIQFADGSSWSRAAIITELLAQGSTAETDIIAGTRFADTIAAGAGNDVLSGGDSADTLTGGLGNDNLDGGYGSDSYHYGLGDGNDRIVDSRHQDGGAVNTLHLGTGIAAADLILERDPWDTYNVRVTFAGQAGSILLDNQLYWTDYAYTRYDHGIDTIHFSDGTQLSRAALITELLEQGSTGGSDYLLGTRFSETVSGGAGADILWTLDSNDDLTGGLGDDNLDGGSGSDTYHYGLGDGHDRIHDDRHRDGGPTNTLVLGPGIAAADLVLDRDQADANNVRITFAGQAGSVLLDNQLYVSSYAGTQYKHDIDVIQFDDGTSWNRTQIESAVVSAVTAVNGTNAAETLNGTAGRDNIFGSGGNDSLGGGAGHDLLRGGSGNDIYRFNLGDGFDVVVEESGTDKVLFGTGIAAASIVLSRPNQDGDTTGVVIAVAGTNDRLYIKSATGIESYEFADGTSWTEADLRSNLYAQLKTAGADIFHGTGFNEAIDGGAGADKIYAGAGADTLGGGTGSDLLEGGTGDDAYVFNLGDGRDVLWDESGTDTVRFGPDIDPADLILSRPHADDDTSGLLISITGTEDQLHVKSASGIERYEFDDGTVWTEAEMRAALFVQLRTDGADLMHGTGFADAIAGGDSADRIYAGGGDDVLEGNGGNDLLEGGAGNDSYQFDAGDGRDVLWDESGTDTVIFGAGIEAGDLRLARPMADGDTTGIVISIAGTADQLYVKSATGVERYEFADGTALTESELRASLFAQARTEGADIIWGSSLADSITGGGGRDRLYGSSGSDVVGGGRGEDILEGGSGNDTYVFNRGDGRDVIWDESGTDAVRFGSGIEAGDIVVSRPLQDGDTTGLFFTIRGTEDRLYVMSAAAIEQYAFSDGTVWTYATATALLDSSTVAGAPFPATMGDDVIFGSAQADTIRGKGGDDVLRGGTGSDTYHFGLGDGYDVIYEPQSSGDTDTLILTNIASTTVRVITSPADADDVVLFIDDANQIYLDQQKAGTSGGIEQIQFSDAVTWTRQDILSRAGLVATAGDDTLIGTNFGEEIEGGLGDDLLIGRAGGDAYLYGLGDGDDVVVEPGSAGAAIAGEVPGPADDRILFGSGIVQSDVIVGHGIVAGDVLITFAAASGSILLSGQNAGYDTGVEFLLFNNGSSIDLRLLLAESVAGAATGGADTIRGFFTDDELSGGLGNDVLDGGHGADRYHFNIGDGADVVLEGGGADAVGDELVLGDGIEVGDVSLRRRPDSPDDLILVIGANGDEIRLTGQLSGRIGEGVELLRFDDGTTWSRDQLVEQYRTQPATSDPDFLVGTGSDDSFSGIGGDDLIEGGAGDDLLGGGDGDDDLRGGAGGDVLTGGAGDDRLSGGFGEDGFDGGDGFDTIDYAFSLDNWTVDLAAGEAAILSNGAAVLLESFTSIEAVVGGAGQDTLIGDAQANRIEGSEGNDLLGGGGGDDVFVYRGSETGLDQVDGGSGTDRIEAAEDDSVIGLALLQNVEQISGTGYTGVMLTGTDLAETLDLGAVAVSGVSLIYMAAGNDVLVGAAGSDTVDLGLGDDVFRISGDQGADAVTGGDGTDRIEAAADNSVIRLSSLAAVEQLSAAGFADVSVAGSALADILNLTNVTLIGIVRVDGGDGNDTLTGSAQADTLRGGQGNDSLAGGGGNDIFEIVSETDGADTVDGGSGTDQILAVTQGVTIRLAAQTTGVETITGLGSALVYGAINDNINLTGVTLNGIVSIDAGSGNDTVIASGAGDTILAGLGNDTLTGNGGNDSYVFNLGDGNDIVQEFSSGGAGSGGTDTLVLGAGINSDDVTISKTGNDVILTIGASGETVTIKSQAGSTTSYWVEEVHFADGTVWDRVTTIATPSYGTAAGETLNGTSGTDVIFGLGGNDTLSGAASADRLFGGEGADTIVGGLGDDVLSGGAGDDIFSFTNGDGYDFVSGGAGYDMIVATANNCAIALSTLSGIEEISTGGFSGVTVWGSNVAAGDMFDFSGVTMTGIVKIDGGSGNDLLIGSAGADTLVGGAGNDTLSGHLGNDSIDGGAGIDTADYSAETATWTINLAAASNHAQSASQTDTLIAIENVNGGGGADTINGSTAANTLNGFAGNDRLTGGAGNDSIQGGLGSDVAVFAGLQASYSIVTAGGSIQIVDNQATVDGNDGTDTLAGVEIAEFKGGVQVTLAAPVVLDLDGNGVTLASRAASQAKWDWNDDGLADRTGWIGGGDGILVYDRNRDGTVSNSTELSFVDDAAGARSDLEGLAAFDTSGDGLLSASDAAWADFRIWADRDLDGRADAGEMLSMGEARVASISLAGTATEQSWGWDDNIVINTGQFTRSDGSTSALADVAFNYAPAAGSEGPEWQSPPAQATDAEPSPPPIGAFGDPAGPAHSGGIGAAIGSLGERRLGLAPLVLDLDGDGVELKRRKKSHAHFDRDGNGKADDTSWIGKDDGFLVVDLNGDGRIAGAAELNLLGLKPDARSSLEALTTLDSNLNGKIDSDDDRFADVKIWRDRNGNGRSEAGELASLTQHGIRSIGLAAQLVNDKSAIGQDLVVAMSAFTREDGSTGSLGAAALAYKPSGKGSPAFPGIEPSTSLVDGRVAQMVQNMASFGARSGENDWKEREGAVMTRFDYFA